MSFEPRLSRLRRSAGSAGLDAVAVVPGPNMVYLTGLTFHLSERPVMLFVPVEGTALLLAPQLEAGKASTSPVACEVVDYDDRSGPRRAFEHALDRLDLGGQWLGVEGRRIRFLELDLMARTGHGPRVFDADELLFVQRQKKSEQEIAQIGEAVAIAERALQATLPAIRAGSTEREVAGELAAQLLRAGADPSLPFSPIVAGGPNGALPHAVPTDRRLAPGDVVTIDWGATCRGYASDITRNFALAGAAVAPELLRAHEAVLKANAAGRAAARAGASGQDVDRAARAVIGEAGFGDAFPHRTGHGLGLEGHEEPQAREGATAPLEVGMVLTVEPGVYLTGLGGVRIEDDVLVTSAAPDTLTNLPRELVAVG